MDLNSVKKYILDIIYPNRCPFCNSFIKWDRLACDNCIEHLPYVPDTICNLCGKYPCECGKREHLYDECYTVCFYENSARKGIISLKANNGINTALFLGEILASKMRDIKDIYCIIPVPMTKDKIRKRGYNQAEEISKIISKDLNIPVRNDILFKHETENEQHTLSAEERMKNVSKMFYSDRNIDLTGKTVVICDDVLTTGSTINSCAKLLKELGADKVIAAVCCTTP